MVTKVPPRATCKSMSLTRIVNCDVQVILSQVGYVLLQLGDVKGASKCFLSAEGLVEDSPSQKHLIHRNRGLLRYLPAEACQPCTFCL